MTQAILCLRGRLLNVEKCRLDRALDNSQIQALIASLGAGISIQTMSVGEEDLAAGQDGSTFDIARLRYHKIIIATEPDERGERMRTSLLAFFYSYMKPLVLNGYVYLAQLPPVVTQLRSCDAEQMETVLLRPDTRRLVQVTEEAALEAVARARKQVQKARANRP